MRLASLLAAFLSACPVQAAAPAALASSPAAASHFDQGRQAFKQGRYEATLREMMMTLFDRPNDARAREYMRLAGEKLISQDLERAGREHQALLQAYRAALEGERLRAETWKGWLLQAQASSQGGRWARSYDDAQRVLDDNANHFDAQAAQKYAVHGGARVLSGANSLKPKDFLIYRGFFFMADGKPSEARKVLGEAVTLDGAGEVEDARLKIYIARLAPPVVPVVVPVVVPALAPVAAAPSTPPIAQPSVTVPVKRVVVRKPSVPAQPGQWAYTEGMKAYQASLYEQAIELFERALSEAPDHAEARKAVLNARLALEEQMKGRKAGADQLYALGLMLYGQGHRVEAVERWRKAVALDPEHGYAARALAHAGQELEEEKR